MLPGPEFCHKPDQTPLQGKPSSCISQNSRLPVPETAPSSCFWTLTLHFQGNQIYSERVNLTLNLTYSLQLTGDKLSRVKNRVTFSEFQPTDLTMSMNTAHFYRKIFPCALSSLKFTTSLWAENVIIPVSETTFGKVKQRVLSSKVGGHKAGSWLHDLWE